jgi:hypothetical protein
MGEFAGFIAAAPHLILPDGFTRRFPMKSLKVIALIGITFLGMMWLCPLAPAVAPVVSDITVSDVTPVSFSIIWKSDIAGTSNLNVFSDSAGTTPVTDITIESQPVDNGDAAIAAAAEDIGVMKVRVSGLTPNATYYFQTETTEKGGSDVTLSPAASPLPEVITAADVVRTRMEDSAEVPFTNDLIIFDCDVAGALLVANVAGGDYPVSGFVGDGVAGTNAYVDLNNVFNFGITLPLEGGEDVELTKFKGIQGIESENKAVPPATQLAKMLAPLEGPPCNADIVPPFGVVDASDVMAFLVDFGSNSCSGDCLGDFDGDDDVDGDDHLILITEFGRDDCP